MTATKTTAEKLAVKPGHAVWTSHPDRLDIVGELPAGASVIDAPAEADVALLFADDAASIRAVLEASAPDVAKPPVVWVAYPKGNRTDVNRDSLWPILGEFGMRPNRQIAIDEVWSALGFRALKPGEEPFAGGK